MANSKVTRLARRENEGNPVSVSTETKVVSFPILMLIVCIAVDAVDIFGYFTVFGAVLWWIFTTLIFTPIFFIYLHRKDKEHQTKIASIVSSQSSNISNIKKTTRYAKEAKRLQTAGKVAEAAAKAEAAFAAGMKLPKWLRFVSVLIESIPVLEAVPIFTIILLWGYLSNVQAEIFAKKSAQER